MSIAIRIGGLAVGSSGGLNPNQGIPATNGIMTEDDMYIITEDDYYMILE